MLGEQVVGLARGRDGSGFGFGRSGGGRVSAGGFAAVETRALYFAVDAFAVLFGFVGRIGGDEGIEDAGGQGFESVEASLADADGLFIGGHLGVHVHQASARCVEHALERRDFQGSLRGIVVGAVAGADGNQFFEVGHIAGVAGFTCAGHDSVILKNE